MLLDTHIWLWYLEGTERELTPAALELLRRANRVHQLLVSDVSVWEIGTKVAKGRLQLALDVSLWVARAERAPGITFLPLDRPTLIESVKKTSRCVIVEEDWYSYGVGAELVATIQEGAFDYLDAPIKRVAQAEVPLTTPVAALPALSEVAAVADRLPPSPVMTLSAGQETTPDRLSLHVQ